jgi:small basic protein
VEDVVLLDILLAHVDNLLNSIVHKLIDIILVPLRIPRQLHVLGQLGELGALPLHEQRVLVAVDAADGFQLLDLGEGVALIARRVGLRVVLEDDLAEILAVAVAAAVDAVDDALAAFADLVADFEIDVAVFLEGALVAVVLGLLQGELIASVWWWLAWIDIKRRWVGFTGSCAGDKSLEWVSDAQGGSGREDERPEENHCE